MVRRNLEQTPIDRVRFVEQALLPVEVGLFQMLVDLGGDRGSAGARLRRSDFHVRGRGGAFDVECLGADFTFELRDIDVEIEIASRVFVDRLVQLAGVRAAQRLVQLRGIRFAQHLAQLLLADVPEIQVEPVVVAEVGRE